MMDMRESIARLDERTTNAEGNLLSVRTDISSIRAAVGGITDRKTYWWGVATVVGLFVSVMMLIWNVTEGFGSRKSTEALLRPPLHERLEKWPKSDASLRS
jgi:hypothetical protein